MTNHTVRLYAFAGSVLVLFLTWAAIAAKPWASHSTPKADPRWAALAAREHRLQREAVTVQRHQQQLAAARAAAAAATVSVAASSSASSGYAAPAAPSVSVVTLPPVTITRTS